MAQVLQGVCQFCGRVIEFPVEAVGTVIPCPHCGRETKLKPAPIELIEAAPKSVPDAAAPAEEVPPAVGEDDPDARLRRKVRQLVFTTVILVAVLVFLIVAAEWLSRIVHPTPSQPVKGKSGTNQVVKPAPAR